MKEINLIFEEEYDNVSIVLVQDEFCKNISQNTQNFCDWTYEKANGCFKIIEGKEMCCVGTDEFVRWLNITYGNSETTQAQIIKTHTQFNPKLPRADI